MEQTVFDIDKTCETFSISLNFKSLNVEALWYSINTVVSDKTIQIKTLIYSFSQVAVSIFVSYKMPPSYENLKSSCL